VPAATATDPDRVGTLGDDRARRPIDVATVVEEVSVFLARSSMPRPARGGRRSVLRSCGVTMLTLALVTMTGACSDDSSNRTERETELYAAVIRAVATDPVTGESRVVYVSPMDGGPTFDLGEQVAVVDDVGDDVDVRFIDDPDEAFDLTGVDEEVLDDGVLLLLGQVHRSGSSPVVPAQRFQSTSDGVAIDFALRRDADGWVAVSGPEQPVPTTAPDATES
jgi:hypothetical protein